ncbi:MAG: hypothetical protein H7293_02925 [Candidatus Saccharibacteria bacterium]|nr:hypothetical protein [Rhodoferax sp.]
METNTLIQVLVALCSIVVAGKISTPCNSTRRSAQSVAVRWMRLRCGFGGMEPIHHLARQANSATLKYPQHQRLLPMNTLSTALILPLGCASNTVWADEKWDATMLARTNNGGEMPLRLNLNLDQYAVGDFQGKLSSWEGKISP